MVEGALSSKTFIQVQNFYAGYEINAAKTSLKPQTSFVQKKPEAWCCTPHDWFIFVSHMKSKSQQK